SLPACASASMCSWLAASASRTLLTPSSLAAASATARQFVPATSTCTSCPSAFAAVSAFWLASLSVLLSCSARRSVVMAVERRSEPASAYGGGQKAHMRSSDHPNFVLELVDHVAHRFDLDARRCALS